MRTRLVGLLAASTLTASIVASAAAPALASCMMDERPMDQKIAEAEIVFVGTVEALAHSNTTASFEVEEVWKGPALEPTVTVFGGSGQDGMMTSVDRTFEAGQRYLVLPFPDGNRLSDNSCSPTMLWDASLEEFRPDDADVRSTPGDPNVVDVGSPETDIEDAGSTGLPPLVLWGVPLVGIGAAAAFAIRFARRRQSPAEL